MGKFKSTKYHRCGRCKNFAPAYYTLSYLTKGLWVMCPKCGNNAAPYVPDLDLPYKPSKHYLKHHKETSATTPQSFDKAIGILSKQPIKTLPKPHDNDDYDNYSYGRPAKRPYYPDSPTFSYDWKTFSPVTKANRIAAHTLLP
jgi:hypothetical protein